jgi:PAB1-binding protein PBP1
MFLNQLISYCLIFSTVDFSSFYRLSSEYKEYQDSNLSSTENKPSEKNEKIVSIDTSNLRRGDFDYTKSLHPNKSARTPLLQHLETLIKASLTLFFMFWCTSREVQFQCTST